MKKIHHMTAKKRIKELKHKMFCLGMSDDYLFSNLSGNLPTYEGWAAEVRELQRGLDKNKPRIVKPYDPQTDTRINC